MRTSFFVILLVSLFSFGFKYALGSRMHTQKLQSLEGIYWVMQQSPEKIRQQSKELMAQAVSDIDTIIVINASERTFANTLEPLSNLGSRHDLVVFYYILYFVKETTTNDALRSVAKELVKEIGDFFVDHISSNKPLFDTIKQYVCHGLSKESLREDQQYFLDTTLDEFKRAGLDLPDDQQEEIKKLKKEISKKCLEFRGNISADASFITVDRDGLAGLDEDFIKNLKQNDEGLYILDVGYPTYFPVMKHCGIEDTRRRLYYAFNNRAYPANNQVLQNIIASRDTLAQKLGYKNYAHYDTANQMAQTPENVQTFLQTLIGKAQEKEKQEWELFLTDMPASIEKTESGKIKPWDVSYITTQYIKKNYDIDDREIAQYFSLQKTLHGLFSIYEQFLGIRFASINPEYKWHDDIQLLAVYDKEKNDLLGYIFLDLHPRAHKFNHAACFELVAGAKHSDGSRDKAITAVVANFPAPTADKPSLLTLQNVRTFFHEFGHALHEVLGARLLAGQSGYRVKQDFVEMPSQMLERWLADKDILKNLSSHYQTGEQLPDELIDKLIALKKLATGSMITRQVGLSFISLNFYQGVQNNLQTLYTTIMNSCCSAVAYPSDVHMYANFGHLSGYSARYYGYLWSSVFADDLFSEIEKYGLLNPKIGMKYRKEILEKGGSQDPNELLFNFLGRKPNAQAYYKRMGLEG